MAASSESTQMAGPDGVTRRPSPEPLRVPVPSTRTCFIDAAAAGLETAADAAGWKGMGTVASVPHGHCVHVQEVETPYSISICSVTAPPPAPHLARHSAYVYSDVHHPGVPEKTKEADAELNISEEAKQARYHPQPTLTIRSEEPPEQEQGTLARSDSMRDRRFDHFKTFAGRLERQLSSLRGGSRHPADNEPAESKVSEDDTDDDEVPTADRYFAALEGPELETLRPTEVPVLPEDATWPFLLRFPISVFGMCMGVSSQAMLWKTLELEPSTAFLHVNRDVNDAFWWFSVALMGLVSVIYLLKVVFYFEAVRREFHHPIRVNFFFSPWIACLFLVKGLPEPVWTIHHVVWYMLMAPLLVLDLKVYGQWMSGGEWRLSRVANPTSHLAVVGNFVGALLGARMGLREAAIFFFAVGLVHYLVLFVTLYQRLPTNVPLPRELHPVFFLFIATPSVASVAWARICGEFNHGAKVAYYISLFLYLSLVVRVKFFRGVRFSLAWWAYTFPMTSAAIATAIFASEVSNALTRALAVVLAGVASVTVAGVLAATMYHAFVRRDLFPNDVSIAVRRRPKAKFGKILARIRTSSADLKELVLVSRHGGSETSSVSEPHTPMVYDGRGRAEP
ncbi:S-type anion channel SLAH2-like [Panicum hallii]|nr:S-type anion channel SLAH2-like [Panicum hallii]